MKLILLWTIWCLVSGCQPHDVTQPITKTVHTSHPIVNGTVDPQETFLIPEQVLAIGYLADSFGQQFCTGTLIRNDVVITAKHCVSGKTAGSIRFGIGSTQNKPIGLLNVTTILRHPSIDFASLVLTEPATNIAAQIIPLAMNREPIADVWLNRWVDASGFGETYSSDEGKFFARVELIAYDDETVTVDGHGDQGICYGDSGGPVIYQPSAHIDPVVVGTEQWGDSSCVDQDHLTRVDVVAAWLENELAGFGCGDINEQGVCQDDLVIWCQNNSLIRVDCMATGQHCGWLGSTEGYFCLPNSCGNIDANGTCVENVWNWCDAAQGLLQIDCDKNIPHALATCSAPSCILTSCEDGYADSDGLIDNGCETVLPIKQKKKTVTTKRGCQTIPNTSWIMMLVLGFLWQPRRYSS